MVIKSEPGCYYEVAMLFGLSLCAAIMFWLCFGQIYFPLIFLGVTGGICLREWIVVGRTITLDEKGILISFLCFTKQYTWSQIKVKRLVSYKSKYGYKDIHRQGLEFCPYAIKEHPYLKSAEYCLLKHPFALVFFYFNLSNHSNLYNHYPQCYPVDANVILKKLNNWGIEISNSVVPSQGED